MPKPFLVLVAAYFITSLGHFAHNAKFICEYPNHACMVDPRQGLRRTRLRRPGHYAVAPTAHHTLGANITILSEVAAAALLLPAAVYLLLR